MAGLLFVRDQWLLLFRNLDRHPDRHRLHTDKPLIIIRFQIRHRGAFVRCRIPIRFMRQPFREKLIEIYSLEETTR